MDVKQIIQKVKEFFSNRIAQFKGIKKERKIAIIIAVVAIIVAAGFGIKYANDSKYGVLFSGLDTNDAATITKELENEKVDTKIKGDSIYVPKDQVDKLRLELSSSVTNGSKGFELMDEGSSLGMTDEEFAIKKQRMIQGEIEKTIKSFPQVESARVHLTEGEESVFSDETVAGQAAVSLTLKTGQSLEKNQIKSIMCLVSASSPNIPKQNVEVVDQDMNLLSEGIFDEDGNSSSSSNGVEAARKAEKNLNSDLQRAIIGLLEPIYGEGKVKATVNSDLNFDNQETTKIVVNPDKVLKSHSTSENQTTETKDNGGTVDNNMNNVSDDDNNGSTESKDESKEYDTSGREETKVIKAQGEINKITASVAIDGNLTPSQIKDVNDMVANTIGMDKKRGDDVTVVSTSFGQNENTDNTQQNTFNMLKTVGYIILALSVVAIIVLIVMFGIKKRKEKEGEIDEEHELDLINQKLEEMDRNAEVTDENEEGSVMSLEDEVRKYASENPEQVTDLINSWLNG